MVANPLVYERRANKPEFEESVKPQVKRALWGEWGLNPRPKDYESLALTG